jgi:hypothetical protein
MPTPKNKVVMDVGVCKLLRQRHHHPEPIAKQLNHNLDLLLRFKRDLGGCSCLFDVKKDVSNHDFSVMLRLKARGTKNLDRSGLNADAFRTSLKKRLTQDPDALLSASNFTWFRVLMMTTNSPSSCVTSIQTRHPYS